MFFPIFAGEMAFQFQGSSEPWDLVLVAPTVVGTGRLTSLDSKNGYGSKFGTPEMFLWFLRVNHKNFEPYPYGIKMKVPRGLKMGHLFSIGASTVGAQEFWAIPKKGI